MTADEIRTRIEKLQQLEEKCFGPRHRKDDFYIYLEAVLDLYLKWKSAKEPIRMKRRVARLYKLKVRSNTHSIRIIIDASSEQDAKVKSRWTRALQYLTKKRLEVSRVGFGAFAKKNGGVIGCATKMSALRAARDGS